MISGTSGCEAYIDDIIIYTETWAEHIDVLNQFFTRLAEAKLTVNLAKSDFGKATVTFLGHVVGYGTIKPIEAKVEAISKFPVPEGKRQHVRFLGMVGYYRKFCRNFSSIAEPLTRLLAKRQKFVWTGECERTFNRLKSMLKNAPVLVAPNFGCPFKLALDASDVAAGAVLLQEDEVGIDHPVCYYSRKFNRCQRNYSTVEKECLTLILALQHFEVYVGSGLSVTVYSDHNPLVFADRMKNKNQRFLRWSLMLQGCNVDIQHIKGKDNIIADCLSRL